MELVQSNLGCFSWIIFGALAGWIASMIAGRSSRQGCLMNIIVGIIGAFLGGAIYSLVLGGSFTVEWSFTAFIVAVLGAVVLLLVVGMFTRRR
jgi:uncharacterized membrane protein YeaQ/YmgE (transglycosylase-associated protein family)